jgi:hypothetical protein
MNSETFDCDHVLNEIFTTPELCQPALGAAISEVRNCQASPEMLAEVRTLIGSDLSIEQVVFRWAMRRVELPGWGSGSHNQRTRNVR